MNPVVRIAVLGLGEAGMEITRDLVAAGADIRVHDPVVHPPSGVAVRDSDGDAVRDADLVISLTTAHHSQQALEDSLSSLQPGTLWADLNTASPALKRVLAGRAAAHGVLFADISLLAPVPGRGLSTPMEASGDGAQAAAAHLDPLGADVAVLDQPAGAAASRKLLRSIFYKGLAAAVLEALDGAAAAGCEPWLHDTIAQELRAFDESTIDRLISGSHRHAHRRAEEMLAAEEQLRDLGVEPRITTATRKVLQELAASKTLGQTARVEPV